jgi:hypothetical protein
MPAIGFLSARPTIILILIRHSRIPNKTPKGDFQPDSVLGGGSSALLGLGFLGIPRSGFTPGKEVNNFLGVKPEGE